MKHDGKLVEEVYRVGGRYGAQIAAIVAHLEAAIPYRDRADGGGAARADHVLPTGEDADREAYDIAWVQDKASPVDTINGFVEVYLDARGIKGAWEALVFYVNREKTAAIQKLAARRAVVRGPHAVGSEVPQAGRPAASPPTPSTSSSRPATRGRSRRSASTCRTIRRSASATAASRCRCRTSTRPTTSRRCRSSAASSRGRPRRPRAPTKWSAFAGELTTNMHEVIGHGSGKVAERLNGNPQAALKEQFSALEESRADLVALYFLPDPEAGRARPRRRRRSRRHRARRVRELRAQRAGAAAPRPRGHADRRRPHAQPPDDRPLADGATPRRSRCARATARPTT